MTVTTRLDAPRLLDLARKRARESREALAMITAGLADGQAGPLTPSELALVDDILRRLVAMAERGVRDRLVAALEAAPACPTDLVWFLAHDRVEIAYPILRRSAVLQDSALIEPAYHMAIEHRLAMARRPDPAAAGAVHPDGPVALARSPSAAIRQAALAYLVDRARLDRALHEPPVRRGDLSPGLARKLDTWVSAALRRHILAHWEVAAERIDAGLDAVLRAAADDDRLGGEPADALAAAVAADPDRLKGAILAAMGDGDVSLVVALCSTALGLRKLLVRRILFEPTNDSLAIIATALGMSRDEFLEVCVVARRFKAATAGGPSDDIRTMAAVFDRIDATDARAVVAHWSRQPGYLGAVRDLELTHDP